MTNMPEGPNIDEFKRNSYISFNEVFFQKKSVNINHDANKM